MINKLVVLDKNEFTAKQKDELRELANEVRIFEDMPKTDEEAIKRIGDADAVIICWYSVNKKIFDACTNLKYVGITATGYDWVNVNTAINHGATVTNVPHYATEAVSDYVINQLKKHDIKNKTLGIIGLGDIGTRTAEKGEKLDLNVIYWSRASRDKRFKYAEFDDVFKQADIIALLVKMCSDTKGLVKNKQLDSLKDDAIIVNVVRSELFEDIDYIIKTINSKNIKLILDYDEDRLTKSRKTNKNIIYTPHIAWRSKESIFNLHQVTIENVKTYNKGKPQNKVSLTK